MAMERSVLRVGGLGEIRDLGGVETVAFCFHIRTMQTGHLLNSCRTELNVM